MKQPRPLDLLSGPLQGINLIEASAGTGKTYTIAGLYLRLLIELKLSISQILVVTFTEAATQELRERIRNSLKKALSALSEGESNDAFLDSLVKKVKDPENALRCLGEALREFDQAAIHTIHGFCRRMLRDYAFESSSLFDTELVPDQETLKREILEDFWRMHLYRASALFVNFALRNRFIPDHLISLLKNIESQPFLEIIPKVDAQETDILEKDFKASFHDIKKSWKTCRGEVENILVGFEGLNRNRFRTSMIPVWILGMDYYLNSAGQDSYLFKGFEKFTSGELERSIKKGQYPPVHPFFDLCEIHLQKQQKLQEAFELDLLSLKGKLFHYITKELGKRKREKNIQSFDDLLLRLHEVLQGPGGEALAKAIRDRYAAALVDEFQDTDPLQYDIFKKAFEKEKSILYLIGDPKQAIYGFRGADVFTYMAASEDVEDRFNLGENWRSDQDLIGAINTIFTNTDRPFVYDKIPYHPTAPAGAKSIEELKFAFQETQGQRSGQSGPPFQLWFLDATRFAGPGKPITKTLAREMIPGAVAGEISRLLEQAKKKRLMLGERPLKEADIAVLVRRNAEADLVQEALSKLYIPSVLYSTGSLFDTHEALEMQRLLAGIVSPQSERAIRLALTTDMIGINGEDLGGIMEEESAWERWLMQFREYHEIWSERGFMRMFRHFLSTEGVLVRLMSLPNGERRNTNLLHLAEVIHEVAVERKLNMPGVLKWISEQRSEEFTGREEHQLRLESDENAVKIVTIHKSKGLEYPVVFCPFLWDGSRLMKSKDPFTFHNEGRDLRLTLDLGSASVSQNRSVSEKERLAENLRLFYVALTRAKNRCYMVWGRIKGAETSAPAYLFYPTRLKEKDDVVNNTEKTFRNLDNKAILEHAKRIMGKAGGGAKITEMPINGGVKIRREAPVDRTLTCREFSGSINRQWRISSFSSLTSGQVHASELADRDALHVPGYVEEGGQDIFPIDEAPPGSIFSFPKGAKAGTCLHSIFENLDFGDRNPHHVESLVSEKLQAYGFDPEWQDAVSAMIADVLDVPLDTGSEGLSLSRIHNKQRLNELQFYFPLKAIASGQLKNLFTKHGYSDVDPNFTEYMGRLTFSPTRGFMKGFMDLVFQFEDRFYLVDWKSNHLGNRVEAYGREMLFQTMVEDYYTLQYHIYTVALDQYLRLRLPQYEYEKGFGGVFYIFLRGVDAERGNEYGIFYDKPSGDLITELREALIDIG